MPLRMTVMTPPAYEIAGSLAIGAVMTPMNNLYVTMLNTMGVKVDRFGDSTGMLAGV